MPKKLKFAFGMSGGGVYKALYLQQQEIVNDSETVWGRILYVNSIAIN